MAQHGHMVPSQILFVLISTFPVPRDIPRVADIRERGQASFTLQETYKCPENCLLFIFHYMILAWNPLLQLHTQQPLP